MLEISTFVAMDGCFATWSSFESTMVVSVVAVVLFEGWLFVCRLQILSKYDGKHCLLRDDMIQFAA